MSDAHANGRPPGVAVVLPGGGARGAYEVGALSVLLPALHERGERIIVIGFEPFSGRARLSLTPRQPRMADVAANILDGLLVDQVADDLRRLVGVNSFFVDGPGAGPSRAARAYRTARGRKPYRRISYALVAPRHAGEMGRLAEEVFQSRYGSLRGLLSPDYPVISRLLGGRTRGRGELLSFLLFDPELTERLIEAGRGDAQRWVDRHPRFWCAEAGHDLEMDPFDDARVREEQTLDEFRQMRRR